MIEGRSSQSLANGYKSPQRQTLKVSRAGAERSGCALICLADNALPYPVTALRHAYTSSASGLCLTGLRCACLLALLCEPLLRDNTSQFQVSAPDSTEEYGARENNLYVKNLAPDVDDARLERMFNVRHICACTFTELPAATAHSY